MVMLTGGTIWGLQAKLLRTHAIAQLGRALKRTSLSLLKLTLPTTCNYSRHNML